MCPAALKDPPLGASDVHHCDGDVNEVNGVDAAFRAVVEHPAEDSKGSFLLACVFRKYGML